MTLWSPLLVSGPSKSLKCEHGLCNNLRMCFLSMHVEVINASPRMMLAAAKVCNSRKHKIDERLASISLPREYDSTSVLGKITWEEMVFKWVTFALCIGTWLHISLIMRLMLMLYVLLLYCDYVYVCIEYVCSCRVFSWSLGSYLRAFQFSTFN